MQDGLIKCQDDKTAPKIVYFALELVAMCPEFLSYNYDQRDLSPDLKLRADSMQLTDTKNRNDPIAMHTHPLVSPIF